MKRPKENSAGVMCVKRESTGRLDQENATIGLGLSKKGGGALRVFLLLPLNSFERESACLRVYRSGFSSCKRPGHTLLTYYCHRST